MMFNSCSHEILTKVSIADLIIAKRNILVQDLATHQVFYKIAEILRRGQVPTVQRVKDNFTRNYNRNYEIFIEKGGRVEYAIDALLDISARDDGWESDGSSSEIEDALPSTPLDGQFDIVHFMCIDRGGGVLEKLGPHRESFGQWRRLFLEDDSDY